MHDAKQIEIFRNMTPGQRWEVWFELASLGMSLWEANLDQAEITRRLEIWRREHELSNQNLLKGLREAG